MHDAAPIRDHVPALHVLQDETTEAPTNEDHVPGLHWAQVLMDVAPTNEDHVPTPQPVQDDTDVTA